ncbi:hypothetical protein, partial [Gluconobacter oxydans]
TFRKGSRANPSTIIDGLKIIADAWFGDKHIVKYENGTIRLKIDGKEVTNAIEVLRMIAAEISVPLLNGNGGRKNTRQLGSDIISALGRDRDLKDGSD